MQRCVRCAIDVRGNKRVCPLCGGKLSGTPEEDPFPMIPRKKLSSATVIRTTAFLFVIFEAVMITLAVSLGGFLPWMPLAMIAAAAVLVDVITLMYHLNNALKTAMGQLYVGLVMSVIVDWFTSFYGWSVMWVLPLGFICGVVLILTIGIALKYHPRDIMLYLLLNMVLTMSQIVFIKLHMNRFPFPAYISIATVLVVMAGVLIFRGRVFKDMTERFFNV